MLCVLTLRPHALARPAAVRLGSVHSLPSSLPFTLAARPLLYRRFLATRTQEDNFGSTETLGQVDRKDRMDDVDVRKYKAAAADVRGETFILVDEPLEKKGTTAEGRHFKDESPEVLAYPPSSDKPVDLTTPFHGDWLMFHPVYSKEDLEDVKVVRRPLITRSDKIAGKLVKWLRAGFDIVSRYKHRELPANPEKYSVESLRRMGCIMSPDQWLMRILFLEVIAGIPGMVAGTLRHLHSLRLMKRDGGWIHSLLEEAENERMHLMSFMTLTKPGLFFRALILGAQGVFYNLFFFTYLLSPKVAHRFVGLLEEEAVYTYTRCLEDLKKGYIPEWKDAKAPEIAISYWRMPEDSKMADFIANVRADEANHRFVNHTLASLDQRLDFNPFALAEPSRKQKGTLPGFTREEAAEFARESRAGIVAEEKGMSKR